MPDFEVDGFASSDAVGSGKDRARRNIEIDVIEHDLVPVRLPQPADCNR